MQNFDYKKITKVLNDTILELEQHLISDSDCENEEIDEAIVLDTLQKTIKDITKYQSIFHQYVE